MKCASGWPKHQAAVRIVAPHPLKVFGLAQICARRFQDGIALLEGCLTSARLSDVGTVPPDNK